MTTNHIHRLDSALIRPGRVDEKAYVGFCSDYQLKEMFRKFYPECKESLLEEFLEELKEEPTRDVSAAEVQGLFLRYKNQPEEAVKHSRDIFEKRNL